MQDEGLWGRSIFYRQQTSKHARNLKDAETAYLLMNSVYSVVNFQSATDGISAGWG